jgi:hypothetical protein
MIDVKTTEDLEKKLESTKDFVLLRGINNYELAELVESGQERFWFHSGTRYESFYGNMVARCSRFASGTVIFYTPSEEEINPKNEDCKFKIEECFVTCITDFRAPVEVYNLNSRTLEQLKIFFPNFLSKLS